MATVTGGPSGLDVNDIDLSALKTATVVNRSAAEIEFNLGGGQFTTVTGAGFTYDVTGALSGGEVTGMSEIAQGRLLYQVTDLSVAATDFTNIVVNFDAEPGRVRLFDTNDTVIGTADARNILNGYGSTGLDGGNSIVGGSGADTITAAFGMNSVYAGGGNDSIDMTSSYADNYIRGGDGADTITTPGGNVNINGNQGDDSIWAANLDGGIILGGQGNDTIHVGSLSGSTFVNGNLGNDTIVAGQAGNYSLHGGQGDDSLVASGGHEDLFGDLGNDTLVGGQGGDTFHFGPGGGHDLVINFNAADRIELDGATSYTVSQVGNDTVVDLGGGDQITLAGVSKSSLVNGWIVLHS